MSRAPVSRAFLAAAALTACLATGPASAGPRDMQFATLSSMDPNGFLRAVRAGSDVAKSGGRFRLILAGGAVLVAIPGVSTVQRDYAKIARRGVEIIACKETLDALAQANRRRIPVIPGVSVQKCEGLRNRMTLAGWQPAPGF